MPLLEETLKKQGMWLFRWRSYLPLIMLPLLFVIAKDTESIEKHFGENAGNIWEAFCFIISLCGLFIRCITIGYAPRGTSGRNTLYHRADVLNTTGAYSICRNPLYLGNFLMILGVALFTEVWWFVVIFGVLFFIYYERIILSEEAFLKEKFGESYINWAHQTPVFFPKFQHWKPNSLSFSFKNVLKKECHGLYGLSAAYFLLDILTGFSIHKKLTINKGWGTLFVITSIFFIIIKILKKRTSLFHAEGR